jgi:hypothetical protein
MRLANELGLGHKGRDAASRLHYTVEPFSANTSDDEKETRCCLFLIIMSNAACLLPLTATEFTGWIELS